MVLWYTKTIESTQRRQSIRTCFRKRKSAFDLFPRTYKPMIFRLWHHFEDFEAPCFGKCIQTYKSHKTEEGLLWAEKSTQKSPFYIYFSWIMVSSKTVVILALSRYIIRNYSEATQNWTEASTLLPWQTNITRIIVIFLSEMPYFAVLCGLLRGSFFLHPFWQNGAKSAKLRINTHISDVVSSKIVVEIGVFYY